MIVSKDKGKREMGLTNDDVVGPSWDVRYGDLDFLVSKQEVLSQWVIYGYR